MEFKDLEIFQKVAEKGTITEAAKALNYVQSNITARIQKLEAEMNTPLFHRHRRGISLTPEGKKLLTYSKKILKLAEEMKMAVQRGGEPAGKLEIGTVETVMHLPHILSAFIKRYNKVDISVITGVTETLEKEVLEYRLDGAFVSEADFHPGIVSYEVFEEELVLISDRRPSSLEEIKTEPFLCFSKGCAYLSRKMVQGSKHKTKKGAGIRYIRDNPPQRNRRPRSHICSQISRHPFNRQKTNPMFQPA